MTELQPPSGNRRYDSRLLNPLWQQSICLPPSSGNRRYDGHLLDPLWQESICPEHGGGAKTHRGRPPLPPPAAPPSAVISLGVIETALGIPQDPPGSPRALWSESTRAGRAQRIQGIPGGRLRPNPGYPSWSAKSITPTGCVFLDVIETAHGIPQNPPGSPRALWGESICTGRAQRIEGIPGGRLRPKPGKPNRVASVGPTGSPHQARHPFLFFRQDTRARRRRSRQDRAGPAAMHRGSLR